MEFLETYETEEIEKLRKDIEKNAEDIELMKSKLKKLKAKGKKLEGKLDLLNNKEFLDNYTEYYNKNKGNYDNFWNSIEEGTNSNLSKWEEELGNLQSLANVETTFGLIENHAAMEVFLQDGLCTYYIQYMNASDAGNILKESCYYLLATNLLAGPFFEEYVTCSKQTVRDLLLRMHKHNIITPQQISRAVLDGGIFIQRVLEYFTGESVNGKKEKAIIRRRYINESKTLYYIAVRKEDGKYYPTTYTSIKKSDLEEKVKELCLN